MFKQLFDYTQHIFKLVLYMKYIHIMLNSYTPEGEGGGLPFRWHYVYTWVIF